MKRSRYISDGEAIVFCALLLDFKPLGIFEGAYRPPAIFRIHWGGSRNLDPFLLMRNSASCEWDVPTLDWDKTIANILVTKIWPSMGKNFCLPRILEFQKDQNSKSGSKSGFSIMDFCKPKSKPGFGSLDLNSL